MKNTNKLLLVVLLAIGALLLPLGSGAQVEAAPAPVAPYSSYTFTRTDRLQAARACVHESTWAGAGRTSDCGGIIQVVMERRRPARVVRGRRLRAETFTEALARTMPRFAAGATNRSWTLLLPSGPLRVDPIGWPYDYPARRHADEWLALNQRVGRYMIGEEPLPCSPAPRRWFGRVTDGAALAATLAEGHWCEARCGESRNAFLTRCAALEAETLAEDTGTSTAGAPSLVGG